MTPVIHRRNPPFAEEVNSLLPHTTNGGWKVARHIQLLRAGRGHFTVEQIVNSLYDGHKSRPDKVGGAKRRRGRLKKRHSSTQITCRGALRLGFLPFCSRSCSLLRSLTPF
ncbi:hypothetical protein TNIN_386051 [Trichonephila inaurata madagascariensis]|uniref:Uncharacterized protein n=1 Tax=Trichonephila inaurata madagascariensis TaxID=2747483 RepID=A0A8X6XVK5_9ARAC|nr:hypothetical protein TNIN_386051 [Trichonephila inaurata madagascariensis]